MSDSAISKVEEGQQKENKEWSPELANTVSTKEILKNFPRHFSETDSEDAINKKRKLEFYNALDKREHEVLRRLKEYTNFKARPFGFSKLLTYTPLHWSLPHRPPARDLIQLIKHYFPPRAETKVQVYDFGDDGATQTEIRLGDIEQAMQSKPDWSAVRWIHAPLGIGLFHSSVEELFFHSGNATMGRDFDSAGRRGWPCLETEILNVRNRQSFMDMCFIANLSKDKELTDELDRIIFQSDNNKKLRSDIEWRAEHVGTKITYWESVGGDLPWQLSEGSTLYMSGPYKGNRSTEFSADRQTLARHPFFENAQLVRDPFRTFHRSDGFLLTLSPAAGIDYLDKNIGKHLQNSTRCLLDNEEASAVAHIFQQFQKTGTSTWYKKTVEWFVVYLITEISTTPHNIRKGYNCPSLMEGYDQVVHELKERRYDPWKRNESIKLVRAYLSCIDELATLGAIYAKKIDFLTRLEEDCLRFEKEDAEEDRRVNNPKGETGQQRAQFALQVCKEAKDRTERLIVDLTQSVNTLFQLRSIEQNELAIVADSQNKAIFVFTGVTIIFLPLSFFASYFGMDVEGITNGKSEEYFWKVCGLIAFVIIVLSLLLAFRRQILVRFAKRKPHEHI